MYISYPLGTRTEGWYVYAFYIGAWGDVSVCDVNYGENTIHSSKPGRTVLGNNNYLKGWYKSGEIGYTEDGDLYLHFTEWWDFFTTGVGGGNKKARNCDDWRGISNLGGYNIHKLDRTSLNDLAKKSSVTWIAVDSPNKALRHYEKTSIVVYR